MTASFRTAIDLQKALENASASGGGIDEDEDYEDSQDEEEDKAEMAVMRALHDLQTNHKTVGNGEFKLPFNVAITRAGCEYDEEMEGGKKIAEADIGERLRRWYEAGAVSGYGDIKAQETKVDPTVRNAREIPASEFRVSPDLITTVQDTWAHGFFPTQVRAEPYKIHLYGPGGKFKPHMDTPETDLVGTFLVGLGDTSKNKEGGENAGALEVKCGESTWYTANVGEWVAFYPDVGHAIHEIASGYRAVIAFKIFRQHQATPEVPADGMLHDIKGVLAKLKQPYGILLHHRYSIGTSELNGFDAALYAAAGDTGADVKLLPVLIRWTAYIDSSYERETKCGAEVFPMTETHIAAVLEHLRTSADDKKTEDDDWESEDDEWKKGPKLVVDLKGSEAEWLSNYQAEAADSIPFYSHGLESTSVTWRETIEEEIEHTGNESRPHSEDSIYLSYAVVVLPKRGVKRAASEEGNRDRIEG
ncbi:hypothetical protein C8R46DRAFT_1224024 [Mycena filopes]|nr:hypothetical protein C8R46DRAFT_1224024 [Mycena filopes]